MQRTRTRLLGLVAVLLVLGAARGAIGERAAAARSDDALPARTLDAPDASRIAAACRTTNPFLAMAVLGSQAPVADPSTVPAVLAFRHGGASAGDAPVMLASRADVGDVYGLAYDAGRQALYAAAYHRRGGSFGPAGPGAIYRIDVGDGGVTLLSSLDAGPDTHDPPAGGGADSEAARLVGKTSLGDLDIADDGSELYVTNLFDGSIYRVALPDGTVRDHVLHGDAHERWADDARVFGLSVFRGMVYHGVVNTRETATAPGVLEARVFRANPGSRETVRILRVGLEYTRSFRGYAWGPWRDDAGGADGDAPMLVDLAFRPDGAPILGLRDRLVDVDPLCVWDPACPAGPSVGDILPGRLSSDGRYWDIVRQPPWYQDTGPDDLEVTFGALAALPGLDVVVSAGRARGVPATEAPHRLAAHWLSNDTGSVLRSEPVYSAVSEGSSAPALAGVAPGDVEALCAPRIDPDPELVATATAEAAAAATVRASEEAVARATTHAATQTAGVPIRSVRQTAAVQTATGLAPTLAVETPTAAVAATVAAATMAAVPLRLTALAPLADAVATRRARVADRPPATATAAAAAYELLKNSCGSHNPYLITTRFVPRLDGQGDPYGSAWRMSQPVVVAFNDTDPQDGTRHFSLAVEPEVGATYGVAYDLVRDQVYVAAYVKRLAELGPLGPGGIYQIDLRTGVVRPWAQLDAGADPHRMRSEFDLPAAAAVGHVGLGDIEMAESGAELYAVNLADKLIYRFSAPDGRLLGAFPHGAAGQWWAEDAAPFGLAVRGGWLYHGVVDTLVREVASGVPTGGRRPMRAYVYRSRPDGSEMREVARVDLDYGRAPTWQPWSAQPGNPAGAGIEAMIADIEFRLDGDLVLGLRERGGDARILNAGHGDMVLTMGVADRYIALTIPEVYQDNIRHAESSWGGLAALPWLDETVSNVIDPIDIYSGGAAWFDNVGGGAARLEEVYAGANQTFGKSAGLGDIEAICAALTPTPSSTPAPTGTPTFTATTVPSATATGTPTPTVTRTPTVTPTATPRTWTIYLPYGLKERCNPKDWYSDVVLVLDLSTSMWRPTGTGRSKVLASVEAAKWFVDHMPGMVPDADGDHAQVAVVGFNASAWIEVPLTGDRAALHAGLERLPDKVVEQTRLDLAIERGADATRGAGRRPANRKVIILLTDGLPNQIPMAEDGTMETTVYNHARAAKDEGNRIYTIAIGAPADTNPVLLKAVATDPAMYFYMPDADDLEQVYAEIQGSLGCR